MTINLCGEFLSQGTKAFSLKYGVTQAKDCNQIGEPENQELPVYISEARRKPAMNNCGCPHLVAPLIVVGKGMSNRYAKKMSR